MNQAIMIGLLILIGAAPASTSQPVREVRAEFRLFIPVGAAVIKSGAGRRIYPLVIEVHNKQSEVLEIDVPADIERTQPRHQNHPSATMFGVGKELSLRIICEVPDDARPLIYDSGLYSIKIIKIDPGERALIKAAIPTVFFADGICKIHVVLERNGQTFASTEVAEVHCTTNPTTRPDATMGVHDWQRGR